MENDSKFIDALIVLSVFRDRLCHSKKKIMEYFNLLRGVLRDQWDCLNINPSVSCATKSAEPAKTKSHISGCDI